VNRFPISAIRAIFILALCLGFSGPFAARPAQAATVFSNYTGSVCSCGFNFDFYAVGFAPASDFEFTGAAAFVQSQDSTSPETFSMALYSSNGAGAPGSSLWTSGPLIAPANTSTLVNASDAGPSISLQGGIEYFLVLNLFNTPRVVWLFQGSSSQPAYLSEDGISWLTADSQSAQFEIFGDAIRASIPEPATWTLLLVGFALTGFVSLRRRLRRSARPTTSALARRS
jgi:hypothetical protein